MGRPGDSRRCADVVSVRRMDLARLFENASDILQAPAGETVFSAGDPSNGRLYVVLEGTVEIRLGNRTLNSVERGGLFGEMALIDEAPRSASAIAQTRCRLAVVDERQFLFMVQQTPFFALQVMRVLVDRLRGVNRRLN
jgi:CRP/FNR family cyclic AMP-dependent transcriptional regulator